MHHWPQLFACGSYQQLPLDGPACDHALAFVRVHEGRAVLVVAARLTLTLCDGDDTRWTPAVWAGTRLRAADMPLLRRFGRWRQWLTGQELAPAEEPLGLDTVFAGAAGLPFAVLLAEEAA